MSFADAFHEVAVLVIAAAAVSAVAVRLRQPLVVAFIAVGVLAGPSVLDVVGADEEIDLLAELGIALVLFVVGLKLDVRVIRATGGVALATAAAQIAFTAAGGFGLSLALGLDAATAAYVAMALTFSSTIIVVKLLSDRREIDELHGRIAVGVLIVQDLVVVAVIVALTALGAEGGGGVAERAALVVVKGVALVAGVGLVLRFAAAPALHRLAHLPELLLLGAIAWAIGLAALADELGFSTEVGAFLAGVALASTDYRDAIGGRLVPLRDFLLVFFFLDLGAGLDLGTLDAGQLGAVAVLSAFVLAGKPLAVLWAAGRLGYTTRVGFLAGVSISQISEFSLIVAALGLGLGHIDADAVALITAIALVTISVSTYATLYEHRLYARLHPLLTAFGRRGRALRDEPGPASDDVDVIVCGVGRLGGALLEPLYEAGHRVLAVDFDPRVVDALRARGISATYGDVEDPELAATLPLSAARWVVCTVRRPDVGLALLHALEHHGYAGGVALTAHVPEDAEILRARGAHHVLLPYEAAAERTVAALGRDSAAQQP